MGIRFIDFLQNKNDVEDATEPSDFAIRKRIPMWQMLVLVFVAAELLAVSLGTMITNLVVFAEVVFIIFAVVGTYVLLTLQRGRDLVLATEFQNLLFYSAIAHSNDFCLIIKNDGSLAYNSPSFQGLFPNFSKENHRSINSLLEHSQVSLEQRKIIFSAIDKNANERVIFDVVDAKKQIHRLIMSVEPIARPRGFTILRGREFVEKREVTNQLSDNSAPHLFNKSSFEFLSYITNNLGLGAYITDTLGNINYASPSLEKWLYYDDGEITSRNLSMKDILLLDGAVELNNFEGEVQLQRKIGGLIKAFINQKPMFDGRGVLIGFVAMVHLAGVPINDLTDSRKNSW